jgi:4-amino-4-deoxy-L-arabinose transferase-like glycosyltransferase
MIRDLLLPTTDAGVVAQTMIAIGVIAALLLTTRRHRDLRLVVVGGGLLVVALMALRAAH